MICYMLEKKKILLFLKLKHVLLKNNEYSSYVLRKDQYQESLSLITDCNYSNALM